jgi:hypothetical protein
MQLFVRFLQIVDLTAIRHSDELLLKSNNVVYFFGNLWKIAYLCVELKI